MVAQPIDFRHDQAFSPALSRVLATRIAQIDMGHTPEVDDAIGVHALIGKSRNKVFAVMRQAAKEADNNLQMSSDMTFGDVTRLSKAELDALDRRLAVAAAIIIAAMDTLERGRAEA